MQVEVWGAFQEGLEILQQPLSINTPQQMKYIRRTAQSIPFSNRRGPFTNGSRTTNPVSASSFVTRRTVRTLTSSSSATSFFFKPFVVCRVTISSLMAMGICRRFPSDMMAVFVGDQLRAGLRLDCRRDDISSQNGRGGES